MSDINNVNLSCRLVEKIQVKYSQSGMAVGNMRIAVNTWSKKDNKEIGNFFQCTVFGKQAEFLEKYSDKGTCLFVSGWLRQEMYQTKEGEKKSVVKIIANDVKIGRPKNSEENKNNPGGTRQEEKPPAQKEPEQQEMSFPNEFESPIDDTDDIPF